MREGLTKIFTVGKLRYFKLPPASSACFAPKTPSGYAPNGWPEPHLTEGALTPPMKPPPKINPKDWTIRMSYDTTRFESRALAPPPV
ncbi:hypothetical protein FQN50_001994 [Emmonsiellopsis sp. PD_5]|nr:hypothetical protein FQN50_001994 [Emmonsiellopsis sp. PD_5]